MRARAIILSVLFSSVALAAAYDIWLQRIGTNGISGEYVQYTFTGNISADPASRTIVATNLEPAIMAGASSQYYRGDKTWQALPAYTAQAPSDWSQVTNSAANYITNKPTIYRTRVQTDGSGNYTWTFPASFTAIPVISCTPEGGVSVPLNVQLATAVTVSNATFKVLSLPSTSILGIAALGAPAGAQAYIHLTAISQ